MYQVKIERAQRPFDRGDVFRVPHAGVDENGWRRREEKGGVTLRPRPLGRIVRGERNHSEIVLEPDVSEVAVLEPPDQIPSLSGEQSA